MAKEAPWDAETDAFIDDLDDSLSKKYNFSIRSLLINPDKYLDRKDIADIVAGIKGEVEAYFNELLDTMKDEQERLESELESATAQYKQIDSVISSKSASLRVPYVKPLFVTRDAAREETIVVEKYSDNLDSFIGKLVSASNYVADVSAIYKQYYLGSWLFSGIRNYVLTLNPPVSPVLIIDNSKGIIDGILDDIQSRASK